MAVIIIRIQVIELRRLGDTVCNSTRFCAFDGVDQDPYALRPTVNGRMLLSALYANVRIKCRTQGQVLCHG